MKSLHIIILLCLVSIACYSQKIKIVEGSVKDLKGMTTIRYEFTYDGIKVGKFDTEQKYIDSKKADYNAKEAGTGDKWEKNWYADRQGRYEPRFIESFNAAGYTTKDDAEYTLILNTYFMEPGFNVGVMRKPAYIDASAVLVQTADKNKVVAKFNIDNAPGRDAWGFDFDTGLRFQESYATAGKKLGRLIFKESGR